jgi:fused signal recognition particle receptor
MFDSLKKKLKEGVAKLSRKAEAPVEEKPKEEESIVKPKPVIRKAEPEKPRRVKEKPPKPKPVTEKPVVTKPKEPEVKPEIKEEPVREEKPVEEHVEEKPVPEEVEKPAIEEVPEQEEVEEIEPEPEPIEGIPEEKPPEPEPEKLGRFARLRGIREKVSARELTDKDIDSFFEESEPELLQSDVALGVLDALREKLKQKLVASKVRRGQVSDMVENAFEESLIEIVDQGEVGLEKRIREAKKPFTLVFLGFNGSGKTTSIAKLASYLKGKGFAVVLAAGDTFRAASIEQLEVHGKRLGIKVIKHQYGSDSAAVIFDARKYAEKAGLDVVLADTAGRAHTDRNLMDELKKVMRVNSPDLKVLVVDSLTGNDAVEQASQFHGAVGVDCVIMTKTDVNPRGGSILSVVHTIGKPILFLGTGQEYDKVRLFNPEGFVKQLME